LAGDAVVVLMDHEGESKIAAFNKTTGEPLWEKPRDERTSWATPFPVEVDGVIQIVTPATSQTRSYNAETGEIIWQCSGLTSNVIPTPVAGFGNVYCTSGYRGYALQAIKLKSSGDLTGTDAIAWTVNMGTPYVASPLLYDDNIYCLEGRSAILSCFDAKSGTPLYAQQRLEGMGTVYASLVGAAGRIYISDRDGVTKVVKHGNNFEELATNSLEDGFDASPVVVGDELYLKGRSNLYCIAAL
jgi:outer membrane protein assembly factor BamB